MANSVTMGRAYVLIGAKLDSTFGKTLASVSTALNKAGDSLQKIGTGLAAAGASIVAPLQAAAYSAIQLQDEIFDLSRRVGVGTRFLSEMAHAGSLWNVTAETMSKSLATMSTNLFDAARGSTELQEVIGVLGLDLEQLLGL